jgi:feruloyl esterase
MNKFLFLIALPLAAQQPCENLVKLALPDVMIQSATPVAAGEFQPPVGPTAKVPAFCRVVGLVKPELKFELWLPAQWNHKYIAVGNGGMAGSIVFAAMGDPLNRGYATGSTDTGHTSSNDDGTWALGHLDRLINYAYRGIHLMAQADKAIIQAFYGAAPAHSYFNGCSFGGKQALTEAQRYPKDFDGIIAGDPANNFTRHYIGGHLYDALAMDGDGYIPAAKVPLIGNAVNAACDALDGVKDGVLSDPRRCHFDPAMLLCKNGDAADCLTAAQVAAIRKIWTGLKDADGQQIYPGLMPGGEADPGGWVRYLSGTGPGKGRHAALTNAFFRYMVFENPDWDYHSFRYTTVKGFDNDMEVTEEKVGAMFNATDPDLRPFRANGGKLIQYHGWSDPDIPPTNSINYYESVVAALNSDAITDAGSAGGAPSSGTRSGGLRDTREFYRLFMVPGMQHCTGGPGTSRFDMLTALEEWAEQKKAPEQIPAAHLTNGKVDRTRPLCAYPQEAKYNGSGNTDDAASFTCALP